MKVIDLLNKIANGEAPKNIKYNNTDYYLFDSKSYIRTDKSRFFVSIYFKELNDEVEIIEEDKKIEKIDPIDYCHSTDTTKDMVLVDTINQIIDKLENK